MTYIRFWFFYIVLLLMSACHADSSPISIQPSSDTQNLTLKTLHKSNICGGITKSQWLSNHNDYQAAFKTMSQQVISDSAARSDPVNFTENAVLLISMGQQRTGGYSIALLNQQLRIDNSTAVVEVRWQEPKPGMMLTQMLSNPCIFIEVPRGEYKTIEVRDQAQQIRASVAIK